MCHSPGSVSHSTEIIGVWHHARLKYLICKASSRTCWRRTLGSRNILTLLFPIPAGCRVLIPYSCNYLGTLPYKALVRVQAPIGPRGACRLETCKTCFPPPTPPWLTASAPSLKLSSLLTLAWVSPRGEPDSYQNLPPGALPNQNPLHLDPCPFSFHSSRVRRAMVCRQVLPHQPTSLVHCISCQGPACIVVLSIANHSKETNMTKEINKNWRARQLQIFI